MVIVGTGFGIKTSGILDPYEQQIKLGYKLINDGNYEEAILAFNKAIEIDVKRDKAYIGLADTYVTRGDENTVDETNETLKRGYEQSESEEIISTYIRLADTLFEKNKQEWAILLLDYGYALTGDERIKSKRDELIEIISTDFMKNLYELCKSNALDTVREIMSSDEFITISKYATAEEPLFYSPDSMKTNKNGKGVGIYSGNSKKYGALLLFYGDYVSNERNGDGVWLGVNGDNNYLFTGKWENDMPNGYGEVKEWYAGLNEGMIIRVKHGVLSDGVWNGDMNWNFIYPDKKDEWIVNFNNGIATVLKVTEQHDDGEVRNVVSMKGDDQTMDFDEKMIKKKCGIVGFEEYDE